MRDRRLFVCLLVVCLSGLLAVAVYAAEPELKLRGIEKLPDADTGEIDGQPAILFWPLNLKDRELLDPGRCVISLEPHNTKEYKYLEFPCGKWFLPPEGRYDAWLDAPDYVSDSVTVFAFGGGGFLGTGTRSLKSVVPAGRIRLAAKATLPARADSLRVVSLRPDAWTAYQRVTSLDLFRRGVNVPAGPALTGIFAADGSALALTRPFHISPGAVTDVTPAKSAAGRDVFLVIDKPGKSEMRSRPGLDVHLKVGTKRYRPEVLLDSRDNLIAVWYGIDATRAVLSAAPLVRAEKTIELKERSIHTVRVSADPNPVISQK